MTSKVITTSIFMIVFHCATGQSAWSKFVIHSETAVTIELTGYKGLAESSLFMGRITASGNQQIDTRYRGLALLVFEEGQRYPVIIGDDPFTIKVTTPIEPPAFVGSDENEFFYKLLSGGAPEGKQFPFALLMIEAKQLLESSHSIHTMEELTGKKKEFHNFVRDHYARLQHSDMVRRLIAQYFMMHEYINYHIEDAPATDIKVKYNQAIMNGVKRWLEILKSDIPEHEILNYCVSLYYNRSMVGLASLIMENFRDVAFCPGAEEQTFNFPEDLLLTNANGNKKGRLNELNGNKIISFVSDDCPVSMVEAVIKARNLTEQKEETLLVAPLQKLSEKHLSMNKMVSGGNMFFVNDETWRKENLAKKIKLPLFQRIESGHE